MTLQLKYIKLMRIICRTGFDQNIKASLMFAKVMVICEAVTVYN